MPEVTFHDGRYWLFSTGFGKGPVHKGEFLQLSTSDDGVHWQKPRAILGPRQEDAFDNWAVVAPTLVRDQGQWLLFYSAFGASPAKRGEFRKQVGPFSLTAREVGDLRPAGETDDRRQSRPRGQPGPVLAQDTVTKCDAMARRHRNPARIKA